VALLLLLLLVACTAAAADDFICAVGHLVGHLLIKTDSGSPPPLLPACHRHNDIIMLATLSPLAPLTSLPAGKNSPTGEIVPTPHQISTQNH